MDSQNYACTSCIPAASMYSRIYSLCDIIKLETHNDSACLKIFNWYRSVYRGILPKPMFTDI